MPKCPFCDEKVPATAVSCPSCGAEVSAGERTTEAADLEGELLRLLDRGDTIEAIKRYRDVTSAGLADAKKAVDKLRVTRSLQHASMPSSESGSELERAILDLMRKGRKIEAVKLYRERTGVGLKEAKQAVESLAIKHGMAAKGAGCLGVLLLLIGAGALASFFALQGINVSAACLFVCMWPLFCRR